MSIDLTKIPEPLILAAASHTLVPFVGSGLSLGRKGWKSSLPNWAGFMEELLTLGARTEDITLQEESEIRKLLARGEYPAAAQFLKRSIPPDKFELFIKQRFTVDKVRPAPIHHSIFKLRPPLLMTTNYDLFLEQAYILESSRLAQVATYKDSSVVASHLKINPRVSSCTPLIFKIHGSIERLTEIILTEEDYLSRLHRNLSYRNIMSIIFMTRTVLMMGFSFSDPDLLEIIGSLRAGARSSVYDYIVLPKGERSRSEKIRFLHNFGLEVIEYEPSDGHPELVELINHLAGFVPPHSDEVRAGR